MSRPLTAQELVFTTLSAKYSPHGKGGYQIVYASPSLAEIDRKAIQDRVGSFAGSQGDPPRWQFFPLSANRSVVTRTQAIPPDGEISDRRGGYLACALVISATEFARADCDPFQLLDALSFPMTAAEVVERYGIGRHTAPNVEITPAPLSDEISLWTGNALRNLLSLTLNAGELATARRTVLVYGTAVARIESLRLALRIAPQVDRAECCFDSQGDIHLARTGGLWAVGLREQPRDAAPHPLVNAGTREVTGEIPPIPAQSGKSLYGRWFQRTTSGDGQAFNAATALRVGRLAAAIESGASIPVGIELDSNLTNGLYHIWREEVTRTVNRRLLEFTTPKSADRFAPWVQGRMTGAELLKAAVWDPAAKFEVASHLTQWLLETDPRLGSRDWQRIGEIAAQTSSSFLTLLVSVLGQEGDKATCEAAFAQIAETDFAALLRHCPARIPPRSLVSAFHTHALISWAAEKPLPEDALEELIEALLTKGAGDDLGPLTPQVLEMRNRPLHRLRRWLEEHPEAACSFRGKLYERAEITGPAQVWWQRITSRVRPPASTASEGASKDSLP
jgi:hypothetical protein